MTKLDIHEPAPEDPGPEFAKEYERLLAETLREDLIDRRPPFGHRAREIFVRGEWPDSQLVIRYEKDGGVHEAAWDIWKFDDPRDQGESVSGFGGIIYAHFTMGEY